MQILLRWLTTAFIILLVAYLLDGVEVASFYTALMVALFLAIINTFVRPILVFLTFPVTVVTLGLFILVINTFLLWLISTFIKGFELRDLRSAFIASVIISIFSWFANNAFFSKKNHEA